ncbi:hypothetical protein N0V90_012056 [Kalmusia sp. IMI 367209]|nr:hypothetical protein N0V90_012056 [Kalmusia sp. IMI 367209]
MVLSGRTTRLEIALLDDLLADLYKSSLGVTTAYSLLQSLVDLLAHKPPRMKILEPGGGTGGATARVLEILGAGSSFERYQNFTFTDRAPTFVSAAEQIFSGNAGTKFSVLEIELDPLEQDFEGEYDLVVASQRWHTELIRNGFSGIDIVLGDENTGGEAVSVMLSSTLEQIDILSQPSNELEVVIVTRAGPIPFA